MTARLPVEPADVDLGADAAVLRGREVGAAPRLIGRPPKLRPTVGVAVAEAPAAAPERTVPAPMPAPSAAVVDEQARLRACAEAFEKGQAAVVDAQRQAGFEEGVRRGLQEGRASGERDAQQRLAAAQQAAAERLRRLDDLGVAWARQWGLQLSARLDAAEDDMVALCHGVICRLLGEALIGREGVAQCVRAAIAQWLQEGDKPAPGDRMVVHVHPLDLEALQSDDLLAQWLAQQGVKGLRWEASAEVGLGGCVLQSAQGDLDARLETQLSTLRGHLLHGRARYEAPTAAPAGALSVPVVDDAV